MKRIEQFREFVMDEKRSWPKVLVLRETNVPELMAKVHKEKNVTDTINRAVIIFQTILELLDMWGLSLRKFEPGHAAGHIMRDYANALRLFLKQDKDTQRTFIGFLGACCHDLGCGVIPRYQESQRVVRHAEVGALLILELGKHEDLGMNEAEIQLLAYAIAAHTQYLMQTEVKCADGEIRVTSPYTDTSAHGHPYLPIWYPRWVDRLDLVGPTMVGRHFLTLAQPHKDYSATGFYDINFTAHMRPFLRSTGEIKADKQGRTMFEHLDMFARSQTNDSPYGEHDSGEMVVLRDLLKNSLLRILAQRTEPTNIQHQVILQRWEQFLGQNIEPTELGKETANTLCKMFRQLPRQTQLPWCNVFNATMQEYEGYSADLLDVLNGLEKQWMSLPMIAEDIRELIVPFNKAKPVSVA